ncbi:cupredoxin domain-containing protein [Nocardioides houyundeii]|uniref:cupredoxin domain-containing protein n=1 Tax=Nocardioides houyundeii TaxID=2045452 RepID=UPI000C759AE1|nr:cupredoxin domain-containing protein [Nocardioides houyundeii]
MGPRGASAGAVLVSALAFAGCGAPDSSTADSPAAPDAVVVVRDLHFTPAEVTVPVGGTVEWRFDDDGLLHQARSKGLFDSGALDELAWSFTFDEPGVYEYDCVIHPYMLGTVTVVDS